MPNYQRRIVYLSDEQRQALFDDGEITVDGVTITYSDNDMYVTPQDEPVIDVQVNGTSVVSSGVANVPIASPDKLGAVKVNPAKGISASSSDGLLSIQQASVTDIKNGVEQKKPIVPYYQNSSVFYGLAKAAGDTSQASSSNSVGNYTDDAKSAIKTMLGVTDQVVPVFSYDANETPPYTCNMSFSDVLAAVRNGTCTCALLHDTNGYITLSNVTETNGGSDIYFTYIDSYGGDTGVTLFWYYSDGTIELEKNQSNIITMLAPDYWNLTRPIPAGTLCFNADPPKAPTYSSSVGIYKAKQDIPAGESWTPAHWDAVNIADELKSGLSSKVSDVQINGTSVVSNGVANVPIATTSTLGMVIPDPINGVGIESQNKLYINYAPSDLIKTGIGSYRPITPPRQHESVFFGLSKVAGVDLANETVTVGTYPAASKTAIQTMLGIETGASFVETVSGTTPSITGLANTRYICGECSTLSVTPPQVGTIVVRFTSGTTATVLTVPSTVKFPSWFDATSLDASTTYELVISDGVYGGVMAWAE